MPPVGRVGVVVGDMGVSARAGLDTSYSFTLPASTGVCAVPPQERPCGSEFYVALSGSILAAAHILIAYWRAEIKESLRTNRDSRYPKPMVTLAPPEMPSALSSAWRNCERRCPKETALLVAEFTAKMLDLERRSEGAGIYRTLDAPNVKSAGED